MRLSVYSFLVLWLQIGIEPFALFHHSVSIIAFDLITALCT